MNLSRWLVYTSAIIHKNPIFTLDISKGMLLWSRYNILKEVFPDFSKLENYYHMLILYSLLKSNSAVTCKCLRDKFLIIFDIINFISNSGK